MSQGSGGAPHGEGGDTEKDPESMEQAVADVVGEVAARKARTNAVGSQEKGPPATTRALPLLLVLLMGVWGWAIYSVLQGPVPLDPADQRSELNAQLAVLVDEIEAHFEDTGEYPADVAALGLDPEGTTYRRVDDGYEVALSEGETTVRYRSGDPVDELQRAVAPENRTR